MGVREALWLIGLALVCYSVWQFFRALRAPRSVTAAPPAVAGGAEAGSSRAGGGLPGGPGAPPRREQAVAAAGAEADEEGEKREDEGEGEDEDDDAFVAYAPLAGLPVVGQDLGRAPALSDALTVQPDAVQSDATQSAFFQLELDNSRLRQALQAQRDLVALQQDEIDRLVHDLTALQDELERVREQPTSSPEYAEALILAAQGLNAEMIAARCGISLAEAELVLSLARRGEAPA